MHYVFLTFYLAQRNHSNTILLTIVHIYFSKFKLMCQTFELCNSFILFSLATKIKVQSKIWTIEDDKG